jgi:tyrosyl-tRNA synthetase
MRVDDLIIAAKMASSKSEARRLITQGGVTVDGEKVEDGFTEISLEKERIIKVGKRKFARVRNK